MIGQIGPTRHCMRNVKRRRNIAMLTIVRRNDEPDVWAAGYRTGVPPVYMRRRSKPERQGCERLLLSMRW